MHNNSVSSSVFQSRLESLQIGSNDRNLRTVLELLKLPGKSFASNVINFGVVNFYTKT